MTVAGSTYWRFNRVFKLANGTATVFVVALFFYLAAAGALDIEGVSHTENCAGSPSDYCYLYLNFTANKDIYVQQDIQWLDTNPPISSIKLQRTWGSSWRTIDLNKTWNKNVKYAVKFSKGKSYQIRFVATKYDPRDVINWSINPTGVWDKAIAKELNTCLKYEQKKIKHYKDVEICKDVVEYYECKNKDGLVNESCVKYKKDKECVPGKELDYVKKVTTTNCINEDKKITYAENILSIGDKGCTIYDDKIICDDGPSGDGNGDGICQSGETCTEYELTDKIELKSIKNGMVRVK